MHFEILPDEWDKVLLRFLKFVYCNCGCYISSNQLW